MRRRKKSSKRKTEKKRKRLEKRSLLASKKVEVDLMSKRYSSHLGQKKKDGLPNILTLRRHKRVQL